MQLHSSFTEAVGTDAGSSRRPSISRSLIGLLSVLSPLRRRLEASTAFLSVCERRMGLSFSVLRYRCRYRYSATHLICAILYRPLKLLSGWLEFIKNCGSALRSARMGECLYPSCGSSVSWLLRHWDSLWSIRTVVNKCFIQAFCHQTQEVFYNVIWIGIFSDTVCASFFTIDDVGFSACSHLLQSRTPTPAGNK